MVATITIGAGALLLSIAGAGMAQSSGCGRSPPQRVGRSTTVNTDFRGISRKYIIRVPPGYSQDEATPIVFSFHGWGSSAAFNEGYMGFNQVADSFGHIMVYVEGMSDYGRGVNNGWQSFNAVGSTTTLSGAPECTARTTGYCYQSCDSRRQGCGKCDWTSCADDGQYVNDILDSLEASYCLDKTRYYATGYSNGGMMAFEIGMAVLERFAALVPGGGQPFVGHNDPPPTRQGGAISVMDLHGTSDRTCPGNSTTSSDGWNYEPIDNVLKVWAAANGCSNTGALKKYDTAEDGKTQLWCVSFGDCPSGVDIVRCSYNLGHHWLGYNSNGGTGARLAFEFFRSHRKVTVAEAGLDTPEVQQTVDRVLKELYPFGQNVSKANSDAIIAKAVERRE